MIIDNMLVAYQTVKDRGDKAVLDFLKGAFAACYNKGIDTAIANTILFGGFGDHRLKIDKDGDYCVPTYDNEEGLVFEYVSIDKETMCNNLKIK